MTKILDGKALAMEIREGLKARVNSLKAKGIEPCLAVVLAGDDPASKIYVRNKHIACEKTGIKSKSIELPGDVTQEELIKVIEGLNSDPEVTTILVQFPLPDHLDPEAALDAISPEKDADGLHVLNAGRLFVGREGVLPCTPSGCMELIHLSGIQVSGANAVIIGRSNLVGKPLAMMLMGENATVTVCHSRTRNLREITAKADILVSAIGRPEFVTADMVKPGAVVIDVGINRLKDGKVVGDVCFDECSCTAGAITPVPGGVGPMTIAMLLRNTVAAAERLVK